MRTTLLFAAAALAEIGGCFAFWVWWRLGKSVWWLAPGFASLVLFAMALALVESDAAGRTFAAYGGIYVAASLAWLFFVEGRMPDRFDLMGGGLCLLGCAVILLGPRAGA